MAIEHAVDGIDPSTPSVRVYSVTLLVCACTGVSRRQAEREAELAVNRHRSNRELALYLEDETNK